MSKQIVSVFALLIPSLSAGAPPKVIVHPAVVPGIMKSLGKTCPDSATFAEGDSGDILPVLKADYLLDNVTTYQFSATLILYNKAGEKLATFRAVRIKSLVSQICKYFEGLKVASTD